MEINLDLGLFIMTYGELRKDKTLGILLSLAIYKIKKDVSCFSTSISLHTAGRVWVKRGSREHSF